MARARIQACVGELIAQMIHIRLQQNNNKTEVFMITIRHTTPGI